MAGQAVPYFQPIIDLDTLQITAYEQLGRQQNPDGSVQSMGPIFQSLDPNNPGDVRKIFDIDSGLQHQAIERLSTTEDTLLFININPHFLFSVYDPRNFDPETFALSQMLKQYSVSAQRIVLEITEDDFLGTMADLVQVVQALRSFGYRIAIDDLGSKMSGLARVAMLQPEIIKVDLEFMRKSRTHKGFYRVLSAISFVAESMGSELLFEGIEEEEDLMGALIMGGRYMQGFYFSEALPDFQDAGVYEQTLRPLLTDYANYRVAELIYRQEHRREMSQVFLGLAESLARSADSIEAFLKTLAGAPKATRKCTLYDTHGNQIYDQMLRLRGRWVTVGSSHRYIGRNAFFQQATAIHRAEGLSYYWSETYQDRHGDNRMSLALFLGDRFLLLIEVEATVL